MHHQGLEGGHDAHGDGGDDLLQVAHLAEEAEEPKGPQHLFTGRVGARETSLAT